MPRVEGEGGDSNGLGRRGWEPAGCFAIFLVMHGVWFGANSIKDCVFYAVCNPQGKSDCIFQFAWHMDQD